MNIPDKAIEAAARAAYDDAFMAHAPDYLPRYDAEDEIVQESWRKVARTSLEAAAPFIAAQALRDAAEGVGTWVKPEHIALSTPDAHVARGYLRARADELDPQ